MLGAYRFLGFLWIRRTLTKPPSCSCWNAAGFRILVAKCLLSPRRTTVPESFRPGTAKRCNRRGFLHGRARRKCRLLAQDLVFTDTWYVLWRYRIRRRYSDRCWYLQDLRLGASLPNAVGNTFLQLNV